MRRLSIIDLSTGRQPITNEDESLWIVFNGDIYNYPELRTDLISRGHRFRTKTDTEVILHLYEEVSKLCYQAEKECSRSPYGIPDNTSCLGQRDRLGIKPPLPLPCPVEALPSAAKSRPCSLRD